MLFVLVGPSYVGKKTALFHFMTLYSFSSITPYTTKPIERRFNEVEGIHYHYVDESNRIDIENDDFIYDTPFDNQNNHDSSLYAYRKADVLNAINSYSNFIIHASVNNARGIFEAYEECTKQTKTRNRQLYIIFLNFQSELTPEFFKERFPLPLGDKGKHSAKYINTDVAFTRRFNHALKEAEFYRTHSSMFDFCVKADKRYEICEKLESIILPKLMVMPTSPDKIAGPLSDVDVVYMINKRREDRLGILDGNTEISSDDLDKLLCGCGIHITLASTIRIIKGNPVLNYIDMAIEGPEMEILLSKTFPEESIATGYVLKPGETILCSSEQVIHMPHDVYAIVSSKFSYTQLGLSIELGTSVIQSGHEGRVHFQIKNNTNNYICIYPHIPVAQLLFFRTVQLTSKKYHERSNSEAHSYDKESITPISKFWINNDALKDVKKPKSNVLKKLFLALQEKVWLSFVGLIVTIALSIANFSVIQSAIETHIMPFFFKSSTLFQCLLIAIAGCVLDNLLFCVGSLAAWLVSLVKNIWIKKNR